MTFHSGHNLGVSRGQNGGQKGKNVPFSSKSEYFEMELANYTLNHIGELTATLMKHDISFLAQFGSLPGSKLGSKWSKCALF